MKYFRLYPWGMQLLLFLLMAFTFMSSAGAIVLGLLTKLTGFDAMQLVAITPDSPPALIKTTTIVQGFQSVFVYMLPAITFAYLTHPEPAGYLGIRKPGKSIQILLSVMLMMGAMPVLIFIENMVGMIDFGAKVKAAQVANDNVFKAFMQMSTFGDFIRVFVILAIVPAVGEELFFRGILMRFTKKRSRTMLFPILFTAAVFSYSHTNIYGYLSIFIAGALLAGIYYLTGSLWCSIAGHLFFNGSQIVLYYLGSSNPGIRSFIESDHIPLYYVGLGVVMLSAAGYLLVKHMTPLPANWTDDFTNEELNQMRDENRKGIF